MSKRSNQSDNPKQQFIDEFEDFGYEVKNVKRSSKKKVSKFKREVNEYDMKKGFATKDELAEFLCDAVCRNFPAK